MSKRRLNKQQQARIKENQARHIAQAENQRDDEENSTLGLKEHGQIITRYAKQADIEDETGHRLRCLIRQSLGSLTAGDRVIFQRSNKHDKGVIVSRLERKSVLGRGDKQGIIRPVAANVDQILIVIAPKPAITPLLLDSYLVAAETLSIPPLIVYNKVDIESNPVFTDYYKSIGYPVINASANTDVGIKTLIETTQDKINVFVGQSGVGKSTLISTLIPNITIKNQPLSTHSELGKHTTSNSTLYQLPYGGSIIDSPGIREFGLWHLNKDKIIQGFIEFRPYIGQCKYNNCTHKHEPQCAVINAVAEGRLSKERLKSLQYLLEKN